MERRAWITGLGCSAALWARVAVAQGAPTQPSARVDSTHASAPAAELTEAPAIDTIVGTDGLLVVRARSDGNVNLTAWTAGGATTMHVDPLYAAAWVDSAVAARAPGGKPSHPKYFGVVLPQADTSSRASMVLVKLSADSAPAYRIDVSDGQETAPLTLPPRAARHLFATLRALPPIVSDSGRTCPRIAPSHSVRVGPPLPTSLVGREICLPGDADAEATALPHDTRDGPTPRGRLVPGTFLLRFIIDETGRVDPASIEILNGLSDEITRSFVSAIAARGTYRPATIGGRPVTELVYVMTEVSLTRPPGQGW